MVKDIVVRGSFGSSDLHSAFIPAAHPDVCNINLRSARFITPAGLVTLAAYAHRVRDKGRAVRLARPDLDDVANYASRAHLGKVLDSIGAEHNLPSVREFSVGNNLLPISAFENSIGVEGLATLVWDMAQDQDPDAAAVLHMSISAMGENVYQHSKQERGYAAAQVTHRGTVFRFAVADAGQGFRRALDRHKPRDDVHALQLGLQPGVSGLPEDGRGYGLSELRDRIEGMGGILRVRSGRAELVRSAGRHERTEAFDNRLPVSVLEGQFEVRTRRR